MKSTTLILAAASVSLALSSCADLGSAMYGGGGGGYNGGGYGNGYGGGRPVYPGHDDHYNSSDHNHHSNGNSGSYHGTTNAGYHTGESCGRQDHKHHLSANYRRHSGQYDHRTESQFARGYHAGYH